MRLRYARERATGRPLTVLCLCLAALTTSPAAASGDGLRAVLSGQCPGEIALVVAGGTPHDLVELYAAEDAGLGVVPAGPCAGTELFLAEPRAVAATVLDDAGEWFGALSLPIERCGDLFQVVDVSSCAVGSARSVLSGYPAPPRRTGQREGFEPNDDGALRNGIPWPTPRFTDHADGTVTDHLTGLVWLRNANCFGPRSWSDALVDAATLQPGDCGLARVPGDRVAARWRLPNIHEIQSLVDYAEHDPALPARHPFIDVRIDSSYWTSTTMAASSLRAWVMVFIGGSVEVPYAGKGLNLYVWPVSGPN